MPTVTLTFDLATLFSLQNTNEQRERERGLNHTCHYAILWRAFSVLENEHTVLYTIIYVYYCISQRRIFFLDIYTAAISSFLFLLFLVVVLFLLLLLKKSRKQNPQKLTQLSLRSHPRHLVGKRTAQKDTIIYITSDSQVNRNFPYRWSPASLTFNNYFTYFYIYI